MQQLRQNHHLWSSLFALDPPVCRGPTRDLGFHWRIDPPGSRFVSSAVSGSCFIRRGYRSRNRASDTACATPAKDMSVRERHAHVSLTDAVRTLEVEALE